MKTRNEAICDVTLAALDAARNLGVEQFTYSADEQRDHSIVHYTEARRVALESVATISRWLGGPPPLRSARRIYADQLTTPEWQSEFLATDDDLLPAAERRALRAIEAAQTEAIGVFSDEQWQPIDTVPKDGSIVLLFNFDEQLVDAGYWSSLVGNPEAGFFEVTGGSHWLLSDLSHWMHRPLPPFGSKGAA